MSRDCRDTCNAIVSIIRVGALTRDCSKNINYPLHYYRRVIPPPVVTPAMLPPAGLQKCSCSAHPRDCEGMPIISKTAGGPRRRHAMPIHLKNSRRATSPPRDVYTFKPRDVFRLQAADSSSSRRRDSKLLIKNGVLKLHAVDSSRSLTSSQFDAYTFKPHYVFRLQAVDSGCKP